MVPSKDLTFVLIEIRPGNHHQIASQRGFCRPWGAPLLAFMHVPDIILEHWTCPHLKGVYSEQLCVRPILVIIAIRLGAVIFGVPLPHEFRYVLLSLWCEFMRCAPIQCTESGLKLNNVWLVGLMQIDHHQVICSHNGMQRDLNYWI